MVDGFTSPRDAALAVLNNSDRLTRKAGSFLGQLVADPGPLSEAQSNWLDTLLRKAKLPELVGGYDER